MNQAAVFLQGEGDAWWTRNQGAIDPAPVLNAVEGLKARRVLEVGCSGGDCLAALKRGGNEIECWGIDPSKEAIQRAQEAYPGIGFRRGTADQIDELSGPFDMILFGFCLYLCDPADLFAIAAKADRMLRDGGHIVIHDFHVDRPYRRTYSHADGLYSHKMAWPQMFLWHPGYHLARQHIYSSGGASHPISEDDRIAVTVLRKDMGSAFA